MDFDESNVMLRSIWFRWFWKELSRWSRFFLVPFGNRLRKWGVSVSSMVFEHDWECASAARFVTSASSRPSFSTRGFGDDGGDAPASAGILTPWVLETTDLNATLLSLEKRNCHREPCSRQGCPLLRCEQAKNFEKYEARRTDCGRVRLRAREVPRLLCSSPSAKPTPDLRSYLEG